jgi:hypothetical protein
MPGPEVVLVPAEFEGIATLALILTWVVAWGLRIIWAATIGWVFVSLAGQLDRVRLPRIVGGGHLFGSVSAFLRSVDRNVRHALAYAALRSENAVAWLINKMWFQLLWMARELSALAHATEHALSTITVTGVEKALKVTAATLGRRLLAVTGVLSVLNLVAIPLIRRQIVALGHRITHAVAIPAHAIAGALPRIGRLERRAESQAHRLTKLEKATVGIGTAAFGLALLRRLGLGWLKCDRVGRAGKAVCGMNPNLLESLLVDVAVLTIALDLRAFTRELQSVTGEAAHLIRSQIR